MKLAATLLLVASITASSQSPATLPAATPQTVAEAQQAVRAVTKVPEAALHQPE